MRIFVADDEPVQREMLVEALSEHGYEARGFADGVSALKTLVEDGCDCLLTDHRMPGMTGLELAMKALAVDPELHVILITAYSSVTDAVSAMKAGAFDYLTKPVDLEHLLVLLEKSEKIRRLVRENQDLKSRLREGGAPEMVGDSLPMREVYDKINRVAATEATVLVLGESGTGKELVARAIHAGSARSKGPFVALNCAALPETLLESELFGHEKGAFTGAVGRRTGKVEAAGGGTLFLDEVGDLPPSVQVKLLRFLQERTFERLGGNAVQKADVRLVAATNRDLVRALADGSFREDLYYRLAVVTVSLPPLRDRVADIPALLRHFVKKFADQHKKTIKGITKDFYDAAIRHPFPGNVRELSNLVENAVVLCRTENLSSEDLPGYLLHGANQSCEGLSTESAGLDAVLAEAEKRLIISALEKTGHVQTQAARELGISERVLRYRMKRLGLVRPD
ncbi:MAG: sigma-54-dependent Fis family transcriptional regulator [Deltaproteobacteria bacterium]|nr:sigma-54-dependent Fis family transcriptional regulator [Deltaproteobacteria bacterium]